MVDRAGAGAKIKGGNHCSVPVTHVTHTFYPKNIYKNRKRYWLYGFGF